VMPGCFHLIHHPVIVPASFQGDVRTGPAGFRAVVQRFLAKEAGRRYQGAREVQAALEATQSGATFLTVERARGPTNLAAGRSQPYWQWWCWLEDFYGNISAEPAAQRGFGQWPYYHWRISRTIRRQEFFADGMDGTADHGFVQDPCPAVISRTSVMQYKGTQKRLPAIARELNVDAVVEGSVMRVGDQVRITAQLVQAAISPF